MAKEEVEPDSNRLSLSEALLAPLNSIFEAQVHASRAFLSFLLQMGFRHTYTPEDKVFLKNHPTSENEVILRTIEEEEKGKKDIEELSARITALDMIEVLTDVQQSEKAAAEKLLRELKIKYGRLHQQPIDYIDTNGQERTIFIPNLALLPIKPLGIQSANFKYEMRVMDSQKTEEGIKTSKGADPKRPWFLVDPKRIEGEFAPQSKENSTDKTIKIEVTVGAMDTPYGLHKLISALTGIAEDTPKTTISKP